MARSRSRKYRDLPPFLYKYPDGSYLYEHPDGRRFSLGKDKPAAMRMAAQLNAELRPPAAAQEKRLRKILGLDANLASEALARYVREYLPERGLSPKSRMEAIRMLKGFQAEFGLIPLDKIGIREVAAFLDALPANTGNKHRAQISQFYAWAIAKGLAALNPAAATLKKRETVERQRLSLDAFQAIHAAAPCWFQNALDLGVQTLQRRQDLCVMRFSDVREGRLFVRQQKVERHGSGRLAIVISPPLQAVIERCRDDVLSPFLVHRLPERKIKSAQREHWSQVMPEMLSRTFQDLRDSLHLYDHLIDAQRPSFHEIRALGAWLYKEAGIDPQALLGHTSAKMTRVYLDRHQDLEYAEVDAGLILRSHS